ncbi:MAG: hypothetical protein JNK05_40210 [Myxococcales bacterium]|nr:hypothetical protein [Myxococcales bacterium]
MSSLRNVRAALCAAAIASVLSACAAHPEVVPASVALAADVSVASVWGAADNDVWIVGARNNECVIARWNGVTATEVAHPPCGWALAVHGTSASNVWVTTGGIDAPLRVLRWDGSAWSEAWSEPAPARTLRVIAATGPDDVWFAGGVSRTSSIGRPTTDRPWLLHWNGRAFEESPELDLRSTPTSSPSTSPSGLVARANGELWLNGTNREVWHHAPGAPLTEWQFISPRTSGLSTDTLVDVADGSVWATSVTFTEWDSATRTFAPSSAAPQAPAALGRGVALDRSNAWFSTSIGVGPEQCSTSGSAFSGIGRSCGPSMILPAIARWNGAAWSTTTMPADFASGRVVWREPTSGALWIVARGRVGRVQRSQLR